MPKVLIIEDDAAFCQMLQKFLAKKGFEADTSFTAPDAKTKFGHTQYDVILTDLRLPDYDGIQLLSDIKEKTPGTPVIVMTGYAEVGTAVRAMKKGAYDYISKPFTPGDIVAVIERAMESKPDQSPPIEPTNDVASSLAKKSSENKNGEAKPLKGVSSGSKKLDEYIRLVAPTDISVLITGESGTGKEVTARAIHDNSSRRDFRFIAVDCGAIPKELATSEFFGHVKGSFTGAIEDKVGNFEAANGGTLFLDEVGNLSYENQVQLLRAIQERKIRRVGSTKEIKVDVRIISATNEDLKEAVEKGTFREDLYHRLNEFSVHIPSLKERHEDLMLFAEHFLSKANANLNKKVGGFSEEVWAAFREYDWPGNLRELQNVIRRAVLLTTGEEVQIGALPDEVSYRVNKPRETKAVSKSDYEKEQIIKALQKTNYNKSKAAKLLQVTRKTLYNRISYYNLDL